MISFSQILRKVLTETVSFASLYRGSESGRKERGRQDVNVKPMRVMTLDQNEAWAFSYKSNPSTTGQRWHGYVQFLKENVKSETDASRLQCMVDCDCPDYRYRYAYNNAQAGAGRIGKHPEWPYGNDNNGSKPKPRSQGGVGDYGVGMCKHLCALGEFLKTKISPEAPEPDDPAPIPKKKVVQKTPTPPAQKPQTTKAPDPEDDTYTDSRTGSDTLTEGISPLYSRLEAFAKSNPEFDVMYYEDESN
jgi:hypothetical protein